MTGAPMIGVIAFNGIRLPVAGVVLSKLHRRATKPPVIMVQGMRDDWLSVCKSSRAMWGTASPINATGPQYAVVTAVCMPVSKSKSMRVCWAFIPRLAAYLSPSSRAFNGLTSKRERPMQSVVALVNVGKCSMLTLLKLPMPHMT